MAEVQKGVGVVWGIGSTLAVTGTGIGTFLPQGVDFDVDAENVEIADYKGETVGDIYFNEKEMLKLEVIPKGTSIALAKAANILPSPGATITVIDDDDSEVGGVSPGKKYNFVSGSKRKTNKGAVVLNFVVKRFTANDVTTTIS